MFSSYPSAFESDRWIDRQIDINLEAKLGGYPRASASTAVEAATGAETIADFQGGSGWPSELLNPDAQDSSGRYVVIEQTYVVEAVRPVVAFSERIQFVDLDGLSSEDFGHFDVLNAKSGLQYLDSIDDIMRSLDGMKATWMFINDLQISSGTEFFSL